MLSVEFNPEACQKKNEKNKKLKICKQNIAVLDTNDCHGNDAVMLGGQPLYNSLINLSIVSIVCKNDDVSEHSFSCLHRDCGG